MSGVQVFMCSCARVLGCSGEQCLSDMMPSLVPRPFNRIPKSLVIRLSPSHETSKIRNPKSEIRNENLYLARQRPADD